MGMEDKDPTNGSETPESLPETPVVTPEMQTVADALESAGYPVKIETGAVYTAAADKAVVFSFGADKVDVTCQVATIGEVENDGAFAISAMATNRFTRPFAFELVADGDDDATNDPIVLADSMPLGDLSGTEVLAEMKALETALTFVPQVFAAGKAVA